MCDSSGAMASGAKISWPPGRTLWHAVVAHPLMLEARRRYRQFVRPSIAYSIFLLLPRGAGSICGKLGAFLSTGVLLYVTVRVTTSRTLTRLERPVLASASQTLGEAVGKGEMAELFPESALFGDRMAAGENGDWGM